MRSGSGRKLPQIPEQQQRLRSNTLPAKKQHEVDEEAEDDDVNGGGAKSAAAANNNKPAALEFWESMENIERNDFRYNTIHRMSVGRRMLPKPPGGDGGHSRSASMDRDAAEKMSLNSSFSGPASLPINSVPASPAVHHKVTKERYSTKKLICLLTLQFD